LVQTRTEEFDPEVFFCPECPLCQMIKDSGVVVFDDSIFEDEEVLLD
jgi:hypothetical protein